MGSRKHLILLALALVALACVLLIQIQEIRALESRIAELQASPKLKEDAQKTLAHSPAPKNETVEGNGERADGEQAVPANATGSYQILKELEADPEKLQELLADNPTDEKAAIACRFIFNMAADTRELPDYVLQALYASQSNPDLKRVIAQVLSQRGNDALLNDQIAAAQATLKSVNPKDRLDALNQLAKIHSVHAVDAIAPSLQDADSTVRLAALFALRDSGNQRHVSLVEPLTHDPDPSVSNLAGNVVSALRNLSSSARTSYSRADIEAELPPIANP